MVVTAIVLALALLVVAVSWGREMDEASPDGTDPDPLPGPRST